MLEIEHALTHVHKHVHTDPFLQVSWHIFLMLRTSWRWPFSDSTHCLTLPAHLVSFTGSKFLLYLGGYQFSLCVLTFCNGAHLGPPESDLDSWILTYWLNWHHWYCWSIEKYIPPPQLISAAQPVVQMYHSKGHFRMLHSKSIYLNLAASFWPKIESATSMAKVTSKLSPITKALPSR